jgi:hypothetical protein
MQPLAIVPNLDKLEDGRSGFSFGRKLTENTLSLYK